MPSLLSRCLISLLAILVATEVSAQQPDTEQATLSGVVVDAATGAPIPGASVVLIQRAAPVFSDDQGRFSFRDVELGPQTLIAAQLGYDSVRTGVDFDGSGEPVVLGLTADPIKLERIEILVDRLANRRRSIGWSVRVFDQRDLREASAFSVLDLISQRSGIRRTPCNNAFAMSPCAYVRGRAVPVRVVLDGATLIGGLDVLATLPPEELYAVEVYAGGREIHAYTTWFIEAVARGRPLPPDPFL